MSVPFNDLSRSVEALWHLAEPRVSAAIRSGWVVLGGCVRDFESAFTSYLHPESDDQRGDTIGVANGTDALELILRGAGVERGTRVGLAANAGFYTSTALNSIGATPCYVDVAPGGVTPGVKEVAAMLAEPPAVFVITHLYGRVAPDIEAISLLCRDAGVILVEDCSQSHGARREGRLSGTFGDAAAFSFYPTKNLGALGDGGGVHAMNPDVARRVRSLRQYGWGEKYVVSSLGGRNSRLDELQAAVLLASLEGLDARNECRRRIVERYSAAIPAAEFLMIDSDRGAWVGHLCVVAVDDRTAVRRALADRGVATDVHFPVPDHRQPLWPSSFTIPDLPNTDALSARVLSVPCFPEMTDDEIHHVADSLRAVLA